MRERQGIESHLSWHQKRKRTKMLQPHIPGSLKQGTGRFADQTIVSKLACRGSTLRRHREAAEEFQPLEVREEGETTPDPLGPGITVQPSLIANGEAISYSLFLQTRLTGSSGRPSHAIRGGRRGPEGCPYTGKRREENLKKKRRSCQRAEGNTSKTKSSTGLECFSARIQKPTVTGEKEIRKKGIQNSCKHKRPVIQFIRSLS